MISSASRRLLSGPAKAAAAKAAAKPSGAGAAAAKPKRVVVVDGVRIPFALSQTIYSELMAVDLMRMAVSGLVNKTGLAGADVDYLLLGTVIQEPRTSNIAREAAMHAGLPTSVPAHTVGAPARDRTSNVANRMFRNTPRRLVPAQVTLACVSANAAICQGAEKILAGQADVVIAGGCETFSDVPIRFSRPARGPRRNAAPGGLLLRGVGATPRGASGIVREDQSRRRGAASVIVRRDRSRRRRGPRARSSEGTGRGDGRGARARRSRRPSSTPRRPGGLGVLRDDAAKKMGKTVARRSGSASSARRKP